MSDREGGRKAAIERRLIGNDLGFCVRLAHRQSSSSDSAIPMLCIANQLSLIVYESARRIRNADAAEVLKRNPKALAGSRHSTKLYDDSKRSIEQIVADFDAMIVAAHRAHFASYGWRRQNMPAVDLGLYHYRGRLVGTTHVVNYNLGMDLAEMFSRRIRKSNRATFAFGKMFGEYVRAVVPDISQHTGRSFIDSLDRSLFGPLDDQRSWEHYPTTFASAGRAGLAPTLSLLQCAMNTVDVLLSPDHICPGDVEAVFKIRYVTLYHVVASVLGLSQLDDPRVDDETVRRAHGLVSRPEISAILHPAARPLRNTLVHYTIDTRVSGAQLDPDLPVGGLTDEFFPGLSFRDVDRAIVEAVRSTADYLDDWAATCAA